MGLSSSTQQKLFIYGYTAKGVVYTLMGFFAVATLIGVSRGATGPKEVIAWLGENAAGQALLTAIGLGLLSYCAYRWHLAVADKKNEGNDATGIAKRIGWAVSGSAYGILSLFAFQEAFAGGGSSGTKQKLIKTLLAQSYGPILVGVMAAIMLGVGVYQIYRGVTDKHMEDLKCFHLSKDREQAFRYTGRIGLIARSLVYGIIAWFLYKAANTENANEFRGIDEALEYLGEGWGNFTLAVVGMGLLSYGLFIFVKARYARG